MTRRRSGDEGQHDLSGLANVGNPDVLPGQWPGLVKPGNLDLAKRKVVHNPDGSISTVDSTSFGVAGHEVLIPQAYGGALHEPRAALAHFEATGQNLGSFDSPEAATAYAEALHREQARRYVKWSQNRR